MRSPVFRVPFCPAGLSSRMCLMKMPLITSPLFSRLPIPRPPTMLMPRDFPGSRNSSTLEGRGGSQTLTSGSDPTLGGWTHFLGWFQLLLEALSSPSPSSRSGRAGTSLHGEKWDKGQGDDLRSSSGQRSLRSMWGPTLGAGLSQRSPPGGSAPGRPCTPPGTLLEHR